MKVAPGLGPVARMPELNGPPMITPMPLLQAQRKKGVERLLFKQRVAAGQQKKIDIAVARHGFR